jgi:hypothetical protein
MRFNRDRRSSVGDELSRILLGAPDALTFDELLTRLKAADVADVAGWLGHALERGYIEELEPDLERGRRFRLGRAGARALAQARRRDDAFV